MIPNAPFSVIPMLDVMADFPKGFAALPPYPLFVKPVTEGSSKGIDGFNKVKEPADLKPAVWELVRKFPGQDILVESFLSGREFTVSILGTGPHSRVIGIREHIWRTSPEHSNTNGYHSDGSLDFASRDSKSSKGEKMLLYNDSHDMDEPHIKATCQVALQTWKVFNCRDGGRVDIRFDSDEPGSTPNVLEVSKTMILIIFETRYLCLYGYVGESYCWPSSRTFPITSDSEDEWPVVRGASV
jgi:D-alanine-D-alanine ligase